MLVDELLEKDSSHRPADAEAVRRRLASIVANDPESDLTVPLVISDELTSTRQYSPDATWSAPPPLTQGIGRSINLFRIPSLAASKLRARISLSGRWGAGLAVVALLAIVLAIFVSSNNSPSTPPSAPAITIPAPAPGTSPLPAPLVRSLNNLARSVES
jgi:hypothetical protein